jgi:hypothetical protein
MLRFSLILHRRTTKPCSVFLPLPSVYRSNRPVTGPYRAVYRSVPNELAFQFGIWICSVSSGNRGLPTGLPKPPAGGSGEWFGKLNPGPGENRLLIHSYKIRQWNAEYYHYFEAWTHSLQSFATTDHLCCLNATKQKVLILRQNSVSCRVW